MRRMLNIHVDVTDLRAQLVDDQHFLRRLNEVDRLAASVDVQAWNACRPAAFARYVGDLAGEHVVVRLLHLLDRPGLQDRIGKIGDAISRLAGTVWHIGVLGIGKYWAGSPFSRQ